MSNFVEDITSSNSNGEESIELDGYEAAQQAWNVAASRLDDEKEILEVVTELDEDAVEKEFLESSEDKTEMKTTKDDKKADKDEENPDEIDTEALEEEEIISSSDFSETVFAQTNSYSTEYEKINTANDLDSSSEEDDSSSNTLDAGEESRRFADSYFSGRDFGLSHNFDKPVSNLFVEDANGTITQLFESELMNPGGRSVDISQFLNGDTLLVAYTIPSSQTMTLGDLLNFTTILNPEMFSMQELPIMTTGGDMTAMVDISSMMSGMMSMFMGSNISTNLDMQMSEDMMKSFMPMMESFMSGMGGMNEMPVEEFMSMMQGMMDIMMQDGMMDDMSAMTESMMAMMQESMSMMPMESFTAMITIMMETFPAQLENSQNPLEDISQAMGSMMLTFMADMNGVANEDAIAEFGASMGSMVNQFMVMMSGDSQDPSAAIGTMMGEMMGSMMTTMADGTMLSMSSFSSILSSMMNDFTGDMAGMSEMLMGMGDFEDIIAQMQEASRALPTLEEMLPSNLYVQMQDGSLVNIRETDLMSADSMSVDISQFLNGSELLVGYTIPNADMMNVEDLMTMSTLTQTDMFTMSEMPMFTLESGDASMMDISSMLTQMMGMFVMDADGMPMSDGVSDAFMDMMQDFMSMDSMTSMPTDEMMSMMSEMMTLMTSSGGMEMMMAMPESMISMMEEGMSAMPLEEMSVMMEMMMQTFTAEMISSEDPMVDMSNTMGAMMLSFMDGMTGSTSEIPAQDFALSMGEMINQFMVAMTGGSEDPAAAMGDMMGSMMSAMMAGMTGMSVEEGESSIDAFSTAMNEMMSGFMGDMTQSIEQMMDPMTDMLNTMMSGLDGSMSMFALMFESMNENAESMIEMSPELMNMMLGLSSQIGAMADEINTMGSSIVDTQVVLSSNFLSTQTQALELIEMISQDTSGFEEAMGEEAFALMMSNLSAVTTSMTNLSEVGMIFPSNLFIQDESGVLSQISETDLQNADGSAVDISSFVNSDKLLVAYTIPMSLEMNLGDLLDMTTMLDSNMFSMQDLPMIPTDGGMISVSDMSTMMNSMMSMFLGGQFLDSDGNPMDMEMMEGMMASMMDPAMMESMITPMMDMMESFMSGMDMEAMMPMMEAMGDTMLNPEMMDSMAGMMDSMMEMMSTSMSAMPIAAFGDMMGVMMDTFTEEFTSSDDPFANMANTMGSMMYAFMNGMTGNDSEAPAQEFALTMGEMVNQFMVGMTGGNEDPAQMMGDMMGSMMGSMMAGMTGDSVAPLESFTTSMSDMMGSFMSNMSTSMVTVMDPMTDMMNTMMSGMDSNMAIISSMFDTANETAGLVIEQSPLYMETILRLSDDIGSMADNIGTMADSIVDTQIIQSSNFLQTQENTLELIELLSSQESMLVDMMGQMSFDSMMGTLAGSADMMGSLTSMSESFPSTLYVEDLETGTVSQVLESEMLDADGSSADISQMLNGNTLLVAYTIPNAQTMDLGSLLSLTTMIEGGAFSLEDLPMIPTDDGSMISIAEMSSMMNSMMGMFMGSQMTSADGSMMDMESMEAMMAPFMDMMGSFMGGMNMDSMMPMMSGMMETMMGMMSDPDMMDSMTGMSSSMMDMMSSSMSAMPIDSFGSMAGVLMDTFTEEILLEGNPMDNMANTMGSMMLEFMNGMTGNDSEAPAQEFALTMGEMINQFMVGVTGGNEDPAAAMGDMMGSMMGGMMAGMTGNSQAPLDSFTTTMSDMMGTFMTDMATSAATVMAPMDSMLNTFVNGIDSNMVFIESMFNTANDTALSLIEQSPEYMTTILRLSDDIGLMADRINEMGDRIVDTQVIQSENFLATQDNMIALIDSLMSQKTVLTTATDTAEAIMSLADFDLMMNDLSSAQTSMESLVPTPEVTMDEIFATQLYMQEADGSLVKISEEDLALADGSTDISAMLNGSSLLVGYTIPNAENMNLAQLLSMTTMIQSSGMDMSQMPMFSLSTGDSSVMDMSGMMESMMGMFMGSGMISTDDMSPDMMAAFSDMMNSFMSGVDADGMMDMDSFNLMMSGMMDSMMSSGMTDSMMDMSSSMMDMMGSSMSAMPMDSFSYMMSSMMESFGEIFTEGDTPMDAMAHTMGSMMLEFMAGMTGNDSEAPAQEFARTMGEMMNQFMVGVTGGNEDPAAAMGDMMGSMMGSFMTSITGDAENPMESFANSMSNMMGSMMIDMSESAAIVMDPMADMMKTFLLGIDGNMEFIASMFDTANGTMQSMIELSPEYMSTILALSDDIGLMAGRIDEMADKIVDTIDLQSTNFEITQANALELMDMLNANAPEYMELLGESAFTAMMADLAKIEISLDDISQRVSTETATIFPSELYVQDMITGELVKMSEADMMAEDGSYVDITQLLDTNSMMVAYTIPMSETMTLSDLMAMTTMVEDSAFSMDMLPMFGENNSIIDINSFMNMALNPETLSMMSMPVDQFNESILTYQEQMSQSDSPFDAMGKTMGAMMMSFMEGMTDSEGEETPLVFAETMGEMVREFMIGATGGNEDPATAMGDMMGSMMGSFMISMTGNSETPMTQFTDIMSDMMSSFSTDMTQSALTMIDPTTDLLNTVVNGINGNMDLIAAMFDSANGTLQALIEQTPVYLDTMVRLSDDIGLMADRINDMSEKIVETEVILSDTFLTTQANSLEVMNTINEQSEYFISMMGQAEFDAMMSNFISLDDAMGGAIQNMTIPDNSQMSSTLYITTADGELLNIPELELRNSDGTTDITALLSGATLLVGYTIPSSASMTLSELIETTTIVDESVAIEQLPMFTLDGMDASVINMSEMMNSMMSLMMGQNMGIPMDELVSEPFMSMMESFANGMGLEVDTFMMMMNEMMDTMMISDMMDSMTAMANQMIESMSFSMGGTQVDTFNEMMSVMMNTFMADGSPLATMADMMGSMMMSIMGEMTPGENDTIDSMAYQMGSMMEAFFSGVTGVSAEDGSPAIAMGDMMGSMMNSFMSSVTGDGESFSDVMQTMMDRFMSDMSESMMAISQPLMDSVNILLNGMDANMELLGSMMANANDTLGMAIDLTPEYISAMTSLSNDIVEMALRVDEMVGEIDTTAQLQLDNLALTQDNMLSLIQTLSTNAAFDEIVANLTTAKDAIVPQVSIELSDIVFEYGIMDVIETAADDSISELFSVSSFDAEGNSADLYEHEFGFSGGENMILEFNESISDISLNIDLTNYISINAFDSQYNKIELNSGNFNVNAAQVPSVITLNGLSDLKYISFDGGVNSAYTISINSFIPVDSLENILDNALIQGVPDVPQELVYSLSLDQATQNDTVVPVSLNGTLSDITIPAGETSTAFTLNVEDDLISQGLESSVVSLEAATNDSLYALNSESSSVSSTISEMTTVESSFDFINEVSSISVDIFSLVEQNTALLDLTNSLEESVIIDTTDLFSEESENSLNSMLSVIGDSGDSVDINADEWDKTQVDSMNGFVEYVSTTDVTVILQVEDDLTIV